MLNIKFKGTSNFFTKLKKKNQFKVGYNNFFFFIFLIKKLLLVEKTSLRIEFFKKKSTPIILVKSYFKYKTSKHKLCNFNNKFLITIKFFSNYDHIYQLDNIFYFFSFLKNYNYFSSPLLSVENVTTSIVFQKKNFFVL